MCYRKRVAELEAKLAALDWTPITESNLPKAGRYILDALKNCHSGTLRDS